MNLIFKTGGKTVLESNDIHVVPRQGETLDIGIYSYIVASVHHEYDITLGGNSLRGQTITIIIDQL